MDSPIPYEDFGGSRPLLHFAHANAYPPGTYRAFLEPLTPFFRVLAVKHRPLWVGVDPDELLSWGAVTQDMISFFTQQGLWGMIGVGHSLGAYATMMAAHLRPELFRALVLIEPVFLPPQVLDRMAGENSENRNSWPWVATALRRRDSWPNREEAFLHFRKKNVFNRWSDEVLSDYLDSGLNVAADGEATLTYPREWEARIYALPPAEIWETIPQIKHPTLAIRGTESNTLSPDAWNLWQDLQPEAQFIEVPKSGHLLPMEKPRLLAEIVLDFCDEQL